MRVVRREERREVQVVRADLFFFFSFLRRRPRANLPRPRLSDGVPDVPPWSSLPVVLCRVRKEQWKRLAKKVDEEMKQRYRADGGHKMTLAAALVRDPNTLWRRKEF